MYLTKKTEYASPAVLQMAFIQLETALMDIVASPVKEPVIMSTGQLTDDFYEDASLNGGSTFNHTWGE